MRAQSRPRQIRVFVSSTFEDMQGERDELGKVVFPQIRKLCERRQVTFTEIDLRWGIPDEQGVDVLSSCFDEIRLCRPFFIGLLAERYGSTLEAVPEELREDEPWLEGRAGASFTELEIELGALGEPQAAAHARFYLRDPAWIETLPSAKRSRYLEVPSEEEVEQLGREKSELQCGERRRRQAALKKRVCESGFPVRKYGSPEELGTIVLEDLTRLLDELYPEGSEPDRLTLEREAHEAFVRAHIPVEVTPGGRAGVYIGRQEYFDCLDRHAAGEGLPLVVLGDPGAGKSALLANWAFGERSGRPELPLLTHFVGATAASSDWEAMVHRLISELQRLLGQQEEIPEQASELREAFADWLGRCARAGGAILILDGLDQLQDRDGALDLVWLPRRLPPQIRLIVATREGRVLDQARERFWSDLTVEPLEPAERRSLIDGYFDAWGKRLSPARSRRLAVSKKSVNPLYLRAVLNEVRIFGSHGELDERIGHYLAARSVRGLFERILKRYEDDYERHRRGLTGEAFSLLASARQGLTEAELATLLGSGGEPLPRAYWSPLYLAAEEFLANRSGLLGFRHEEFRRAVEQGYLKRKKDRRAVHLRLAAHFEALEKLEPRRMEELPYQLSQAESWKRLYEFLVEPEYLLFSPMGHRFDLETFWARLEQSSRYRMADAYREAIEALPDQQELNLGDLIRLKTVAGLLARAGNPQEALLLRQRLVDFYRQSGNVGLLTLALGELALSYRDLGDSEQALATLDVKRRLEGSKDASEMEDYERIERIKTLDHQGMMLADLGRAEEALEVHRRAEQLIRESGEEDYLQATFGNQARALSLLGRQDEALRLFERQAALCRSQGDLGSLQHALGNQGSLLASRGELKRAAELIEEQERICRQLGDRAGLAAAQVRRASMLFTGNDPAAALELLDHAEEICSAPGAHAALVSALDLRSRILTDEGDRDGALETLGRLAELCQGLGNTRDYEETLLRRGSLLAQAGRRREALEALEEQESLCREHSLTEHLAQGLALQALVRQQVGEEEAARRLYEEAEVLAGELDDQERVSLAAGALGDLHRDRGDYDQALECYRRQEAANRRTGDLGELRNALAEQADILVERGEQEEALRLFREQEPICRQTGNQRGLAYCLDNQGALIAARGELEEAIAKHEEAAELFRRVGDPAGVAASLGNRGMALKQSGDLVGAGGLYLQAEEIWRRIGDEEGLQRLLGNKGNLLLEVGDPESAAEAYAEREQICEELGLEESLQKARLLKALALARIDS